MRQALLNMLLTGQGFIMTLDITQIIFASTINTFKNFDTTTGSISVPNQSYTAGQYRTFTTTIDIAEADATMQVLQNYSFDSSKYYSGMFVQVNPNANFIAQTRMSLNGTTLTVDLFVANITGGTVSVPAFTVDLQIRRFLTPFS